MKKLMVLFLFILVSQIVLADEYPIYIGDCRTYNSVIEYFSDGNYAIKYDDQDDIYYFWTPDYLSPGWIYLTKKDLADFRLALEKYFEWESLAVEKQIELEKELPININTEVLFKYGDDWYRANNITIHFTFFSQSPERHQLVIFTNKVKSTTNEYIDYDIDDIYLDKNQVQELLTGISEENIMKVIEDHNNEKKANDDLFT